MFQRRGRALLLCLGPWIAFVGWHTPSRLSRTRRAASASPPVVTHLGINSLSLEIAEQRLLVDPFLTGSLVFGGQKWAFCGKRPFVTVQPEEVLGSFDAVVITQGLDDHCHRPTLERIDRRMPIIANPSAAKAVERLGFTPRVLTPGESLTLGHLEITAIPGSVVGPPWQEPENGYVFADTRPGGLSIGTEPHGNLLGPALGTSFRALRSPLKQSLDAVILPLTSQEIAGYRLVNGVREAVESLESLEPVPRFLLPLRNAEIEVSGLLAAGLVEDGSAEEFLELQRSRPKLKNVRLLDLQAGQAVQLS